MTTTTPKTVSQQDGKSWNLDRYRVKLVPLSEIKPSPENDQIYGACTLENDPALPALMRSIEHRGLAEPLLLTADGFILSGHRRFYAVKRLEYHDIPARYASVSRADVHDYHRLLTEYNPQRVKSVAAMLAESMLNKEPDAESTESWTAYKKAQSTITVETMAVDGSKFADAIGARQKEFLLAAHGAIVELEAYWPLSIRQIHYKLLNNPPLTQTTANRNERWRYRNSLEAYGKLSNLLTAARYGNLVPWEAISDETRHASTYKGFDNTKHFLKQQMGNFLKGYHRSKQEGQPNHIELIVEKNTLLNIVRDISEKLYIPLTPLRGYGGPSVWREIELRWREAVRKSTSPIKPKCILVMVTDHDPEGFNLADDAIRSLRDGHNVDVEYVRAGLTTAQVKQYNLPPNPAKESSARFAEYVGRTGARKTWECEALDPEVLRKAVHDALLSVMDTDQLNAVQERQEAELKDIAAIRQKLSPAIIGMMGRDDL